MQDIRPALNGSAEIFKYYKNKKTQKLTISKQTKNDLSANNWYGCREDLASEFVSCVDTAIMNIKVRGNPYTLHSTPVATKDDGYMVATSSIGLRGRELKLDDKKVADELCKTLDYVLGILSVCLAHDEGEVIRRKEGTGLAGSYVVTNKDKMMPEFWYKVLSPFWVTSPILLSLVFGVSRDCFIMCADGNIDVKELFKLVPVKEIHRIINEVDYKAAIKVYRDVILKWYEREELLAEEDCYDDDYDEDDDEYYEDEDNEDIAWEISILSNPDYIDAIDEIIGKKGYLSVFNPKRVYNHWKDGGFSNYGYGLRAFYYDIINGRLKKYNFK